MRKFTIKKPEIRRTRTTKYGLRLWIFCLLLFFGQASFAQDCEVQTSGFSEDFNEVAPGANSIPDCWNFIKTGSGIGQVTWGYEYFIYNMSDTSSDYILVSPETENLGNGTMRVRFSARTGNPGTATALQFGTLSNHTDETTFTLIEEITLISDTYTPYVIELPAGTDDYFGFRHGQNAPSTSIYLDDIYYEEIPSCLEVSVLTMNASNPTPSSMDLSWESDGTSFDIEFGPKGFTPTGTPNRTEVSNPYTLTELNHSTTYDYYVRQNCGGGDTSIWSGPYTFTTSCDVYTSDFSEDFETTEVGNSSNPTVPNCWNFIHGGYSSAAGYTDSSSPHSGSKNFYIWNGLDTTGDYILVSPETDNLGNGTGRIKFFASSNVTGTTLQFGTLSNNTDGETFTALQTFTLSSAYEEFIVDIPAGTDDYFGFRHGANYSSRRVLIDDITYGQQPSCPDVLLYTMGAENITANSADLFWESTGTAFDVEFGEAGFTPTGIPNNEDLTGVSNPFTLNGLNPDTAYDYYVRRDCGSSQSIWVGPYTFMTDCELYADGSSEDFEMGSIANPQVPNCWNFIKNGSAGNGYIRQGTTSIPAHSGSNHFYLSNGGSSVMNVDYILVSPETQDLGNGTMRVSFYARANSVGVSLKVGTLSDNTDAATFTEVDEITLTTSYIRHTVDLPAGTDDYFGFRHGLGGSYRDIYIDSVVYEKIPSCPEVHFITMDASNITENSAELSWISLGTTFDIEFGETGFMPTGIPNNEDVTGISNPFALTGLDPNTIYDYYVRRNCGGGDTSTWTGPYTFRTECAVFTNDFSENFDTTLTGNSSNTTVPDCWGFIQEGNGFGYVTTSGVPNTSPNHFTFGRGYPTTNNEFILVSPRIEGLGNGNKGLTFYAKSGGSYATIYPATLHIGTLSDGSDETTFTELETFTLTTAYTEYTVSLPAGADEYFAFRVSGVAYPTVFLDNIIYEEQPVVWTLDNEWLNDVEPTIEKDVIIQGNLSVGTDYESFSAKTLIVKSTGNLIIESGNSLTVEEAVNNAGIFEIESGASLIQIQDVGNTGEIIVHRNSTPMKRIDNTLWSSPVAGQSIRSFSPGTLWNRFWTYNEATDLYAQYFTSETGDADFSVGEGVAARIEFDPEFGEDETRVFEGKFTGVPFNGTQLIDLTNTLNGYNIVGNPYASNLRIGGENSFLSTNTNVQALYFWTHDGTGTYATVTRLGSSNDSSPEQNISVGQGFIVGAPTGGILEFNNEMRVAGEALFYKTTNADISRIWLSLSDSEVKFNQILVGYMEQATNGVDTQIDGTLLESSPSELYSLIGDEKYAVQGRAPFESSDTVPMGIKIENSGAYVITLENVDGLFADGQTVYLKDNTLNVFHNLSEQPYSFESTAGEFNNRFEIVYITDEVMGNNDLYANSVQVYTQNHNIIVSSESEKILSVELYDLSGRILHKNQKVNANFYQIRPVSKEILAIKVLTQTGKIITKKIINN